MDKNQALLRLLKNPHEEVAYHMGASLRGFNVKVKPESYLLTVKIDKRIDGPMVGFIEATSMLDCFSYLEKHLNTTNAPLRFRPDKWAR